MQKKKIEKKVTIHNKLNVNCMPVITINQLVLCEQNSIGSKKFKKRFDKIIKIY